MISLDCADNIFSGPLGVVSLALFHFVWPKPEYLPDNEKRTWSELDFLGSGLLIAAAVLVVFPFQNASREALFKTAVFLAPLLTGIACWFVLIVWELFVGAPIQVFSNIRVVLT